MSGTIASVDCEGCAYHRPLRDKGGDLICRYMLDTGKRCQRDGDKCLSKSSVRERAESPFNIPMQQR